MEIGKRVPGIEPGFCRLRDLRLYRSLHEEVSIHTSMYVVGHIRAISSNFFPLSYFTKCFMQYFYLFKKIREKTDGGK